MPVLDVPEGAQHPPRDRYGNPTILNPDTPGDTLKAWRPSSLADAIEDKYALQQWATRVRLKGAGARPDLAALAAPLDLKKDREELDRLAEETYIAGGGAARANQGTARHLWLEQLTINPDQAIAAAPEPDRPDLAAIAQCITDNNIRPHHDDTGIWQERLVITRVGRWGWTAGTADLHATVRDSHTVAIVDLKTGKNHPHKNPMSPAVQLACYANAEWAWPHPDSPLIPTPPTQTGIGYLLWAPLNQGTCELVPIDIYQGWDTALLAGRVKQARRNLARFRPAEDEEPDGLELPAEPQPEHRPITVDTLRARLERLVTLGVSKADIGANWPPNTPTLKRPDNHNDATLEKVDRYVRLHETREGVYPADRWRVAEYAGRAQACGTTLAAVIGHDRWPASQELNQADKKLGRLEQARPILTKEPRT